MTLEETMQLLEGLKPKQVSDFFEEVVGSSSCPICKHELTANPKVWMDNGGVLKEDPARVAISTRAISGSSSKATASAIQMPVFTTYCDQCGFMADFAVPPIISWLEGRYGD